MKNLINIMRNNNKKTKAENHRQTKFVGFEAIVML